VRSLALASAHPQSRRLAEALPSEEAPLPIDAFAEQPGRGLSGVVKGQAVLIGSPEFLRENGVALPADGAPRGVQVAIHGAWRGAFSFGNVYRPAVKEMIRYLRERFRLALLSGDHAGEEPVLREQFGPHAELAFEQSPLDKIEKVRALQAAHQSVLMLGDGLNDAGALRRSDVGIAVTEDITTFSPACDAILEARALPMLPGMLRFSRAVLRVVTVSFAVSFIYNIVGISLAARGLLSPLLCAILMPLSSVTVVLLAVGLTDWSGRRHLHRGGVS
jgi:Cu+-exporting ATPase